MESKKGTQEQADNLIRDGMVGFGVAQWKIDAIYAGVRLGGKFAWESNAKLKAQGEGRVLSVTPTDPLVTWDDWKKNPLHFVH